MINVAGFNPKWSSAPGNTIHDFMNESGVSSEEICNRLGLNVDSFHGLLNGKLRINFDLAQKLSSFFQVSTEFWTQREERYRYQLAQEVDQVKEAKVSWAKTFPVSDMKKFGWIESSDKKSIYESFLSFFDVTNVVSFEQKYKSVLESVAFRQSFAYETKIESVLVWLRQGEILAEKISTDKWNKEKFKDSLKEIKKLTSLKDPDVFLPELESICKTCGVALVIVPTPSGCHASGATRFINEDKAIMMLSFRHLTDDQFWFTFFHEAGHLILHETKNVFIDGLDKHSDTLEIEANEFAVDCILEKEFQRLLPFIVPTTREVVRFAVKAGISPGLVVGQLQFRELIGFNKLNGLKRRYKWKKY